MPIWTFDELKFFGGATNSLPSDELTSRFARFGGIPRYIFRETQEFQAAKADLDTAIVEGSTGGLEVLRAALGNMESGNKLSHKLIHYKVDTSTYETFAIRYASDYVERELPLKAPVTRLKELGKVLCNVADAGLVMEGHIFEEFLHRMIPLGVSMIARSLQTRSRKAAQKKFTFPSRDHANFNDNAEMVRELEAGKYTRPTMLLSMPCLNGTNELYFSNSLEVVVTRSLWISQRFIMTWSR